MAESEMQTIESERERIEGTRRSITANLDQQTPCIGSSVLAGGLASIFLNRLIDSPITVGVFGESGIKRSSLMIEMEKIMLLTSAQYTFPNLLPFEVLPGVRKIILSKRGKRIYEMIKQGAAKFFLGTQSEKENPLLHVLKEYQPEYHSVYRSLACMDTRQMLQSNVQRSSPEHQEYVFGEVPRILTIHHNIWHFTDESLAWAGLSVSITKEIEKAMTKEQWLSTCWRYNWEYNNSSIWLYVLLPCLLATYLSGWVAWMLLIQAQFQCLNYGFIPISIIILVWVVVIRSITSVVIPVSTQMMEYITSPNHTSYLRSSLQVISDINFLKNELGKKSYPFFSFILGKWCWNWFGLCGDYVGNTSIVKSTPASEGQLRIITFLDDLDRCEEKVVLKILSSITLLAECKINVILGIGKKMIERTVKKNFEYMNDRDIVEKFLGKIIQFPLSLPDSPEEEMQTFLAHQSQWESSFSHNEDPNYNTSDSSDEKEESVYSQSGEAENEVLQSHDNSLDTQYCTKLGARCNGIMKKIFDYLWKSFSICKNISNTTSGEEKLPLSKEIRLARTMTSLKCNEDEAEIFLKLIRFATGNKKFPGECKRLLNYHRLAWIVLSYRGAEYNLPKLKLEWVAWVFVCWQWKYEMNILIKGWHKYARIGGNHDKDEDESCVAWHGPSLGQIVEQYVIKLEKVQGPKRGEEQKSWHKLKEALKIQDVSMKGVQLFQQFRLHCETDHLPWPLPKSKFDGEK